MALKENKILYTMGEVSEMLDVSQSLLRFWESKFDIIKPHKNKKGNRLFTPADVENLKLIYHLAKEKGMKLDAVRKTLKNKKDTVRQDAELMERLTTIRSLLMQIRQELGDDGEGIKETPAVEEVAVETVPVTTISKTVVKPIEVVAEAIETVEMPTEVVEIAEPKLEVAPAPRIVEQTLF